MKKRFIFSLSFVLITSVFLAACGNNDKNDKASESKGSSSDTFTVALESDVTTLDPHDTNDNASYTAESAIMEGLLGFDKDNKVVPVLAKSYEVNKDSTEFTFKLKKGIKFQDGTDFNAEAVKTNIDRLADPESKLKRHSLFELVKETKVIDDDTVRVTLSKPFAAMINNFAHPAAMMISPDAIKKYGDKVSQHPVGTGPFTFEKWQHGEYLKLTVNKNYWNKDLPKVHNIVFKPVPENGARIAMLQTGEADFIYPVPPTDTKTIENTDGLSLVTKPSLIVKYFSMNTMKKPFNDVKVRQAINYAIDKEAFLKVVYNGYASEAKSSIAPDTQFYAGQTPYEYNIKKAKQLLKEAGYPNGFEATIWGGNSSDKVKMMEFYKQQLDKVGITLKTVPMESGTIGDKIWGVTNAKDADLELYNGGWSPSTGDADWGLRPVFGGEEAFPPNSYNTSYYQSNTVNSLLNQALQTSDTAKRKELYGKAQQQIWEDAPWVFLAVPDLIYAKKDSVDGVVMQPSGVMDVRGAEKK
ncbi:glutathione ABC transporter substrate-binding protein [Bacillus vallismortis]|uniref:glutathione ABC transporter substrate-binding protein n=1 Tax=Bacillus vallismortis TaxID=72361 RepID=UPI000B4548EA|nr:glutathione ABC transporter substrate-binding protein [Bacillus subtilis]MDM5300241.1 glutathione ABC transporter substrate-binding protein [Bacillus subtilis]MDM5322294.1 glutathione ABC transporter substrate-binding protein [Bacillus subtilis]